MCLTQPGMMDAAEAERCGPGLARGRRRRADDVSAAPRRADHRAFSAPALMTAQGMRQPRLRVAALRRHPVRAARAARALRQRRRARRHQAFLDKRKPHSSTIDCGGRTIAMAIDAESFEILLDTVQPLRARAPGSRREDGRGTRRSPGRHRPGDEGPRPLRPVHPRGIRRDRPLDEPGVPGRLRDRPDRARLPLGVRHQCRHRLAGHPDGRHGGAEARLPAAGRDAASSSCLSR